MGALGAILVVVGGVLATRSALLLAGRGRPRRGPQPAFVIAGPYRRTRNPLFAGVLLAAVGISLATRSVEIALLSAAAALVAHVWVVRIKERRLAARFGDAYAAYLRHVPRWLPRSKHETR